MNKYQEDYAEFIKSLKYIDELVDSLTIEQRKSLGATTWSIQGVLGRYINEEKDFIKELVDKETPMKPIDTIIVPLCPRCHKDTVKSTDYSLREYNRCTECGQKIDWSDEE